MIDQSIAGAAVAQPLRDLGRGIIFSIFTHLLSMVCTFEIGGYFSNSTTMTAAAYACMLIHVRETPGGTSSLEAIPVCSKIKTKQIKKNSTNEEPAQCVTMCMHACQGGYMG